MTFSHTAACRTLILLYLGLLKPKDDSCPELHTDRGLTIYLTVTNRRASLPNVLNSLPPSAGLRLPLYLVTAHLLL